VASPLQLGPALLETTSLSEESLQEALRRQEESGGRLTDLLLELEALPEGELLSALSKLYGLAVRDALEPEEVDPELAMRIPISFAKHHHVIPVRLEGNRLEVAISDPLLTDPLDDLRLMFDGAQLRPVLATRRAILNCINHVYDRTSAGEVEELTEEGLEDIDAALAYEPEDLLDASEDSAPVIQLVNTILRRAVKERASDIHIEPQEREVVVRFRTDDLLHSPIPPLPRHLHQALVSRIKIMGKLNIAEKRLPQDGRIPLKIAGRDYDVRLSTIPTQYGERCVLRLLPRTQELLDIASIGMAKSTQATFDKLIHRSSGIILVTGPTGSGKNTTLFAGLHTINTPDKNIITIENPIEIRLPGISQIEVNDQIDLTFANVLRSILRQDPEVILIGEIRDLVTAEIAIQASLTGHLVFSTLHTIDAAGSITRLIEFGVEPFLISSALAASLAQRLVRILCTQCREPYTPTDEELAEIGIPRERIDGGRLYRAAGCVGCNHTGYYGRTAIFEILTIDDNIRSLISRGIDAKSIQAEAVRNGMVTMRMYGALKVLQGKTSVAEIMRQTEEEAVTALDPEAV
jgi:general secretion pathway protein E